MKNLPKGFLLRIYGMQNENIQGELIDEKENSRKFSSTMELMLILNGMVKQYESAEAAAEEKMPEKL